MKTLKTLFSYAALLGLAYGATPSEGKGEREEVSVLGGAALMTRADFNRYETELKTLEGYRGVSPEFSQLAGDVRKQHENVRIIIDESLLQKRDASADYNTETRTISIDPAGDFCTSILFELCNAGNPYATDNVEMGIRCLCRMIAAKNKHKASDWHAFFMEWVESFSQRRFESITHSLAEQGAISVAYPDDHDESQEGNFLSDWMHANTSTGSGLEERTHADGYRLDFLRDLKKDSPGGKLETFPYAPRCQIWDKVFTASLTEYSFWVQRWDAQLLPVFGDYRVLLRHLSAQD